MKEIYLLSPWVETRYKMTITSLNLIKHYLEDHGYHAEIIDCAYFPKDLDEVLKKVGRERAPIVGITGYTRERFHAYDLIRKIRLHIPDATIIVGGRHFGFLAEETLTELPEVDIVVRGEGEITMKEICDVIIKGGTLSDVSGLSYRREGDVVHNPDRTLEDNLDQFRVYSQEELERLSRDQLGYTKTDHTNQYLTIHAARGCPNKCVFCSVKATKVRYYKIESIIKEIKDKVAASGIRNISFSAPSLTVKKSFIVNLCNAIIEEKLNIHWRCYSRVDIDPDILKLMRKSGLESVDIGLETGSPKILKTIKKRIQLDQFHKFVKQAHELGIKVWVFCMVSFPDETPDDAEMTLDFVKKIAPFITNAGLQTTRITPDAALYQIAMERGVLPQDFSWFSPYKTPYVEITRPQDETLPVYKELLTVDQILAFHDRFREITSIDLATFDQLKQGVKYNLNPKVLKSMTLSQFMQKTKRAGVIFFSALRKRMQ